MLANLEGRGPLVRDEDVAVFGRRDAAEAEQAGSQRIEDTDIVVVDLATIRERGAERAARAVLAHLIRPEISGVWVHLDCDAVDDVLMPAVDYRLPGGLAWTELETVLRLAIESGRVVGVEITIFNPTLDPDGTVAHELVACLTRALKRR